MPARLLAVVVWVLVLATSVRADEPKPPFELKPETRNYDIRHLMLDVRFDLPGARVEGTCAITLAALQDGVQQLYFHSEDTEVLAVAVDGGAGAAPTHARRFRCADGLLRIDLETALAKDQSVTVRIEYEARPTKGLYFFAPNEQHPEIPWQVWSQGEGRDNHAWFPCYDEPDDRFTSEVRARVPAGFTFISNGRLMEAPKENKPAAPAYGRSSVTALPKEEVVWHYRLDQPHVNYLITAIVGQFDRVETAWQDVALIHYVPPGRASEVPLAFGLTPDMMRCFSEFTGEKYPYGSYAQITVWDFMYGGMENTSATTLNLRALHDERSHLDYQADGLVAHELAHQWFGDLITCNDWSEMWLNEGFATYFTSLWVLDHEGAEAYAEDMHGTMASVRGASTPEFRSHLKPEKDLPRKPTELPVGLNYTKGSSVLHMLRGVIGPEKFRDGIRRYVAARKHQNAVSEDLRAAMEAAAGQDLGWFFDAWVYGAGYPTYSVQFDYSESRREGTLRVRQMQVESKYCGLFRMPVDVTFWFGEREDYHTRTERVWVDGRDCGFTFAMDKRPAWVRFDDGEKILKRLEFPRSQAELALQLALDNVTGRIEAAEELGRLGTVAVPVLRERRKFEPAKGVRLAIVEALAGMPAARYGDGPVEALTEALDDTDSKVRTRAARGLGDLRAATSRTEAKPTPWAGPEVARLKTMLLNDVSYYARAAAARALGVGHAEGAYDLLHTALGWWSYREVIRESVVEGLVALRDPRALPDILALMEYRYGAGGQHHLTRKAIEVLAAAESRDGRVIAKLEALLHDPYFRTRAAAAGALARLRSVASIPVLLDRWKVERMGEPKGAIENALRDLAKPPSPAVPENLEALSAAELRRLADAEARAARDQKHAAEARELRAEQLKDRAERLDPTEDDE